MDFIPLLIKIVLPSVIAYINTGRGNPVFIIAKLANNLLKFIDPIQVEQILRIIKTMIKNIELDLATENQLRANLLLEGETEKVQLEVKYRKMIGPKETEITIEDVAISRPWLNILYNDILKNNVIGAENLTFKVSNIVNSILK